MKKLEHVQAAAAEANKYGATFDYECGSSKITGYIHLNGKCRKLFMSITPSDHRVCHKVRKNVRDYIKEMQQ